MWGAGSLLSCEALCATWSDVVVRSVMWAGAGIPREAEPAGARVERFRAIKPKHGCCGLPSELPYFTRIAILRAFVFGYGTDTTSLPSVEAFPSVEVGRCGFILGFVCGAIRWLLLQEVACHRS